MTTSYSTNLALALPVQGELSGTWGTTVNTSITNMVDEALGYQAYSATGGSDTLTIPDGVTGVARSIYIQLNGTGGGTVNVPATKTKMYFVFNNTSSAITFKVTSQTGVSIPAAAKMALVSNGTDIIVAQNYFSALTLGAALPIASGGTGSTSTTFVNLTTNVTGILPAANGGTGVANNAASTITISGSYATTLTLTGTTSVALPTTGTLATLAGTETFTNKTLTSPVIATIVNSGTLTLPTSTDTLVGRATTDTLTNKTLTTPTVTGYTETAPAIANSGATVALSLASGTVLSYTLTANCTFTMPGTTSGTSFIVKLIQNGTGSWTATFTGVKWPANTPPTITPTATTGTDVLSFVCINSVWYGTFAQAFA